MLRSYRSLLGSLTGLALASIALPTSAQKAKTPPTKGQGQLVGGDGRFGTIYIGRKLVKLDEKVFRYYIAGATKAEAGEDGDPKNVIAPLPANVADPSDKSGATALDEGKGAPGQELPSGAYHLKLNSAAATTDPVTGNQPRDGKKYIVLNVSAKMMTDSADKTIFYLADDSWQLTDSDGDRYKADSFLKASSKSEPDHEWVKGDEYTFRVVFIVPKEATLKKVVIGARNGRKWAFDGSIIQ